jgi:hypothetical protein
MTSTEIKGEIVRKFCKLDERGHTLLTPFVVSRERKVIYFHIAKTGGSSIVHLLQKNGLDDNILSNKKRPFEEKIDSFLSLVEDWDSYYKFTFVRNKYDQLVSLYNYDRAILGEMTFAEFIQEHVNTRTEYFPMYDYWIDQHFLTVAGDQEIFDFVGRFENYEHDLKLVCANIGIPFEDIRSNLGTYDKTKKSSYYTPELKHVVDTKFAREKEHFNWELQL